MKLNRNRLRKMILNEIKILNEKISDSEFKPDAFAAFKAGTLINGAWHKPEGEGGEKIISERNHEIVSAENMKKLIGYLVFAAVNEEYRQSQPDWPRVNYNEVTGSDPNTDLNSIKDFYDSLYINSLSSDFWDSFYVKGTDNKLSRFQMTQVFTKKWNGKYGLIPAKVGQNIRKYIAALKLSKNISRRHENELDLYKSVRMNFEPSSKDVNRFIKYPEGNKVPGTDKMKKTNKLIVKLRGR
jgi:hypothetical protein